MFKKFTFIAASFILSAASIFAQTSNLSASQIFENLSITKDDILIERSNGKSEGTSTDGYNLYIRKKEGVGSVMLVETLKDPEGKRHNYAFRAKEYNPINGDEIRYLDGKKLESNYSKYSLISSTPTRHPNLGECFMIYIPSEMEWGYPWARNGTVKIDEGTFINIRTFEKKYGDYSAQWKDNPFMFAYNDDLLDMDDESDAVEETEIELNDNYSLETSDAFTDIAKSNGGRVIFSKGPFNLSSEINKLLDKLKSFMNVDVVFAIDTTGSMSDDIDALKTEWVPSMIEHFKGFNSLRVGLLCYRDYTDNYNYDGLPIKLFDFTSDVNEFTKNLNSITIKGNEGGDVPEAVYEALYGSINFFQWRENAKRCIILIGDAEPHPVPKGKKNITKEKVYTLAKDKNIQIDCIITPNN